MTKYIKKAVVIESFRYGFDKETNWFTDKVKSGDIVTHCGTDIRCPEDFYCEIKTLEGIMRGSCGDFIIQGVNGEIYPCKYDIFLKTYDKVIKKEQESSLKKEESAGSVFMDEIRRLEATKPSIEVLSEGSGVTFSGVPFDATETNIITSNTLSDSVDCDQYRFDLIKAVLPALVQGDNSAEHCAKKSIEMADDVIKLLKEERLTKDTKNVTDGIQ